MFARRLPAYLQIPAILVGLFLILLVISTGVRIAAGWGTPQSFSVNGEFTLFANTDGPASNCYGTGGFSDIAQGLAVTVRNESGTILGTSRLGAGSRNVSGNRCEFTFVVRGIPKSAFYSVEVGRRGELTYSHSEMVQKSWRVTASLGR